MFIWVVRFAYSFWLPSLVVHFGCSFWLFSLVVHSRFSFWLIVLVFHFGCSLGCPFWLIILVVHFVCSFRSFILVVHFGISFSVVIFMFLLLSSTQCMNARVGRSSQPLLNEASVFRLCCISVDHEFFAPVLSAETLKILRCQEGPREDTHTPQSRHRVEKLTKTTTTPVGRNYTITNNSILWVSFFWNDFSHSPLFCSKDASSETLLLVARRLASHTTVLSVPWVRTISWCARPVPRDC